MKFCPDCGKKVCVNCGYCANCEEIKEKQKKKGGFLNKVDRFLGG